MRQPEWHEVKSFIKQQIEGQTKQLLTCELNLVEKARGRIEAYQKILRLEEQPPQTRE
jgi:hypothetical protein